MKLAAYQMDVRIGEVAANVAAITDRIRIAGSEKVSLAVFPECSLSGYCFESRAEALPFAVDFKGPEVAGLIQAATDAGVFAAVGMLERSGDQLFNAQVLIGPGGLIGSYRKIHLPALGCDRFVDPGDRAPQVFDAGAMRVGLAICYDSSFPELSRVLALEGADVIALSTNWPAAAHRVARHVPPCRSMENHLYFVAANRVGEERGFKFCGLSSIYGPDAIEYARATGDAEIALYGTVDIETARSKRIERTPGKHVVDFFADRRPQFYGRITRPTE